MVFKCGKTNFRQSLYNFSLNRRRVHSLLRNFDLLFNKKNAAVLTSRKFYSTETDVTAQSTLPAATRVVICGGGLFGTSVAYHLAQLGYKDVALVTKDKYVAYKLIYFIVLQH